MDRTQLFQELLADLSAGIRFQVDKPDETAESTLKALWSAAAGYPVSATKAGQVELANLTDKQVQQLHELIQLRLNNKPLAYITQRQSFMGIELLVDERALIPRKETEILGNKALEVSQILAKHKKTVSVMDVCCGSGNLGLALALHNPNCHVQATDLSEEASALTRENIHFLNLGNRVQVKQGDLFSAFDSDTFYNRMDLIVCNPPYILSSRVDKMDKEIATNEPVLAFDGGMLGISIIQKLLRESPKYLSPEGWLAFEIGAGQGPFILQLIKKTSAFEKIQPVTDQSGTIRVVVAKKSKTKSDTLFL